MDEFLNILSGRAAQLDQMPAHARIGIVTSSDPQRFTARVLFQPEGSLSGWLPIMTCWAGNGWGLTALPSPGDQVLVLPQEGAADHGIILGRLWSSRNLPPAAPAGELWLVHAKGAYIKLHNDGSIESCGQWTHRGSLEVTHSLSDFHGSLDALRTHYNSHSHPDTGPSPVPQD